MSGVSTLGNRACFRLQPHRSQLALSVLRIRFGRSLLRAVNCRGYAGRRGVAHINPILGGRRLRAGGVLLV